MSETLPRLELTPGSRSMLSRNDRFAAITVILITGAALALGLLLKQSTSNQSWLYVSQEAGVEAVYPAGWLSDESGHYVVRLSDPEARPYKTQFILRVVPAGGETSIRNILDNLILQRASDLAAYRVLSVTTIDNDQQTFTEMNYAFVDTDPNPFVQQLPVVVLGRDVVIVEDNQAIIVTYMSDQESFEENLPLFERFLANLRY